MIVGLILVTPIVVTVFVVDFLFRLTTKWVLKFVPPAAVEEYSALFFQAAALVLVLVVVFFIGLLTRNIIGQKLYRLGDMLLARIPFINKIYVTVRQISEALVDQSQTMFKEVVLVEYPRKGLYTVGFITAAVPQEVVALIPEHADGEYVSVFVATVPNPTSGFFVLVPRSQVRVLPISVADGMKMVISAGAVYPGSESLDNRPTLLDKLEAWVTRDGKTYGQALPSATQKPPP
jgi:uncharacterized membrane protein